MVTFIRNDAHPHTLAVVDGDGFAITDGQSVAELIAAAELETESRRLIVPARLVDGEFYLLASGRAAHVRALLAAQRAYIALWGEFDANESPAWRDFMRESTAEGRLLFVATYAQATARLGG